MNQSIAKVNILRRAAAVILALLVFVGFVSPLFASAELASGEVGKLKWSISGGELKITGKGVMPDFTEENMAPWLEYSEYIRAISLDSRITHIGQLAFYDCAFVTAVDLPQKVKSIGNMAFAGCSAMTSVTLRAVESIGEYAFSRCFKLSGVILPETLKTLGSAAFYRCESLRSIRVPSSVTAMGGSVFAYCSALSYAEIAAPIETLPEWSFYGCESLSAVSLPPVMTGVGDSAFTRCEVLIDVYYDGPDENREAIVEGIISGEASIGSGVISPTPEVIPPTVDIEVEKNPEDNTFSQSKSEVAVGPGASVETVTTTTHPVVEDYYFGEKIEVEININAFISDKNEGWDTLLSEIERQILEQGSHEMELGGTVPIVADTTLLYGSVIYGSTLKALAGKDVVLRLRTPNGSCWIIDCSMLKGRSFKKSYDLEYVLSRYEKPSEKHLSTVGGAACYWLDFAGKIDFPATIEPYIDSTAVTQTATIYEASRKSLKLLQSVMIGSDGVSRFYMGNVNKGKNYVIALNVSGISAETVIRPENTPDADWLENYVPVTEQYVITDVRGFMGLTMKQFTGILIGVGVGLGFVVFVIILVVSLMGKRKAMRQIRSK